MTNYSRSILFLFITLNFFVVGFAQIKTGGFKKVSVSDAAVVAAAEFALESQADRDNVGIELISIESAERQTVAGTNHKICMLVTFNDEYSEESYDQFVSVIVFRNLKKIYALTSWTEVEDCGGEE
jgi:hypothetical protein